MGIATSTQCHLGAVHRWELIAMGHVLDALLLFAPYQDSWIPAPNQNYLHLLY